MLRKTLVSRCSSFQLRDRNRFATYDHRSVRTRISREVLRKDRLAKRRKSRIDEILTTTLAIRRGLDQTTDARDLALAQLANNVFSAGHQFLCSSTNVSFVPNGNPAAPEVALIGRERVGKTALLRSLFKSTRAVGRSNTLQRKQAINYFSVGDVFNIADIPGYGGIRVPWSAVLRHAALIRNFARCRPNLKMLYYCMDAHFREGLRVHDVDLLKFMTQEVPNFTIVVTKGDALATSGEIVTSVKSLKEELLLHDITHPVMVTSAFHMTGIDTLRYDMVMNAVHTLPTERLTLTEARKLGKRLLSRAEIETVRELPVVPTAEDDELTDWKQELAEEEQAARPRPHDGDSGPLTLTTSHSLSHPPVPGDPNHVAVVRRQETLPPSGHVAEEAESALAERDKLFNSLTKKLSNAELIKYVNETSPWRDPMKWPANVIPTKHPKSNIMKSPQDPNNPYIFQPQFAAPRMDMYFRRPNLPTSGGKKKGQYVPDDRDFLRHEYTVPYFPEVVDVNMTPQPWAFVGSTDAYFEKSGGRALGLTLMNQAVAHQVNPLSNNPVPQSLPLLAEELKKLEEKRYGAPIAFLRPIGAASHDKKSLPAVEAPSQAGVAQEASGTRPAALRGESDMVHEDLSAPPL